MTLPRSLKTLTVALAVFAPAASAQHIPGIRDNDGSAAVRRYHSEVYQAMSARLDEWGSALRRGELQRAGDAYAIDAMLALPDRPAVQGRDAIQAAFREMGTVETIETGLTDYVIYDRLAYGMGWFRYQVIGSDGTVHTVRGTQMVVFWRDGREWRIRSQLLRRDEG